MANTNAKTPRFRGSVNKPSILKTRERREDRFLKLMTHFSRCQVEYPRSFYEVEK